MDRAAPFLILAFDHPLRAVESVGHSMAAGLRTLGIDAEVLAIPRDNERLAQRLGGPLSGILSLGPLPLGLTVRNEFLHRVVQCPVWLYFLDSPIYDLARVPVARVFLQDSLGDDRLVPVSPEAGHQELWRQRSQGGFWASQARVLRFACFPRLEPRSAPVPRQARVCVIGTIGSELGGGTVHETLPQLLDRVAPRSASPSGLDAVAHQLLSPHAPDMPVQAVMEALQWSVDEVVDASHLPFLCAVDSWVKRRRRLDAVRSLAGQPVDFFGGGWQQALGDVDSFRYVGNLNHDDIAKLLTHYAAVVNFDPNWRNGIHDRVYTACSMGVNVITNMNSALADCGLPSDLIHAYDANRPDLAGIAERLIAQTREPARPRLDVIGTQGWSARMAELLVPSIAEGRTAPSIGEST